MRIDKFLGSLLPWFRKDSMKEDIANIRQELVEITIPPYIAAEPILGKMKFKSPAIRDFAERFARKEETEFTGNYIVVVCDTLEQMVKNIPVIEKLVTEYYADDIYRDGMTFLRANILQYIETMSYVSAYARKLLVWTWYEETMAEDEAASAILGKPLTEDQIRKLLNEQDNFINAVNIMSQRSEAIEKQFAEIPDINAKPDNVSQIEKVVGISKIDPFKFGFIVTTWMNPIYHVRMKIAEWQVARYNEAKEEKKSLELRLLHFKSMQAGKPDAGLQHQIEYTEDRVRKLSFKLAQVEAEYA